MAVHVLDLGLMNWVKAEPGRSILFWARGLLIMRYRADPKAAVVDFAAIVLDVHGWLHDRLRRDLAECAAGPSGCRSSPGATGRSPVGWDCCSRW